MIPSLGSHGPHLHLHFPKTMATSGSSSSPSPPKRQRLPAQAPPPPRGTDMLMALPSDILDGCILALLPFDKLVRTSCLSRAWRRRWESIKNLDIELTPASSGGGRALWRCAKPIRGFRARVARRNVLRAARWLRALARKGVQDLSLEFSFGELRRLPGPALFSCAALVRLDLEKCTMPAAPRGFRGFPNLERLHLVYVTLAFTRAGTQLEHLIVAAENLAVLKLSLLYTTGVNTWAIRAPKLRELVVTMPMGVDIGCRIPLPLPMLEEATISFDRLLGTRDFLDAFQNISTVNKLCFTNYQFNINMLEGITCKFENLREARLTIDFGQHSSVLSIVSLLKFAPHIEHLCIRTVYSKWEEDEIDEDPLNSEDEIDEDSLNCEDEIDEDSLNSEDEIDEDSMNSEDEIDEDSLNSEISSDLLASLKYVTLTNMKYNSNQMCFMKLLLSKARSLQTFDVTFVYGDESNEFYGNAWRELMECQKASPQVVLTAKLTTDSL